MTQQGEVPGGGKGKWETSSAASAGLTAGKRAPRCVNSRVSRKMRRPTENTMESTRRRGGAFTASTYEPTFRGRSIRPAGFPGPFPQPPYLSLSLARCPPLFLSLLFRPHYRPPPPTISFIDCPLPMMTVNPRTSRGCFAVYLLEKTLTDM